MKQIRIYLGDLTHNTRSHQLRWSALPLNIGYVASYCKKIHSADVGEIRLFKYAADLERAIQDSPPDVLALSNYSWSVKLVESFFSLLGERRPEALRVMGGPHFSHRTLSQINFLKSRPWLDAYVYLEGEVGFSNFISLLLQSHDLREMRNNLKEVPVNGCTVLNREGKLLQPLEAIRIKDLDEIPSPYLLGLMDEFFDGQLDPIITTNRGCPFQCTFCHDGNSASNKISNFSLSRVKAEIEYIAQHVPRGSRRLFVADLNFGMYKRDLEICQYILEAQQKWNFPDEIESTTGKNAKDRVISAVESLNRSLRLSLSVQSMTESVLKNIRRDNIRLNDFLALQPAIQRAKLPTLSELIMGLPGETWESFLATVAELVQAKINIIAFYPLMLFDGAELNEPEERHKWGLKTMYRISPEDFCRLESGKVVLETEEIVVGSNTMTFADHIKIRKLGLLVSALINHGGFEPILEQLRKQDDGVLRFLRNVFDAVEKGESPLGRIFKEFEEESASEFWNSREEIYDYFRDPKNYDHLVSGAFGKKLVVKYAPLILTSAMPQLVHIVLEQAETLLDGKDLAVPLDKTIEMCLAECERVTRKYRYVHPHASALPSAVGLRS